MGLSNDDAYALECAISARNTAAESPDERDFEGAADLVQWVVSKIEEVACLRARLEAIDGTQLATAPAPPLDPEPEPEPPGDGPKPRTRSKMTPTERRAWEADRRRAQRAAQSGATKQCDNGATSSATFSATNGATLVRQDVVLARPSETLPLPSSAENPQKRENSEREKARASGATTVRQSSATVQCDTSATEDETPATHPHLWEQLLREWERLCNRGRKSINPYEQRAGLIAIAIGCAERNPADPMAVFRAALQRYSNAKAEAGKKPELCWLVRDFDRWVDADPAPRIKPPKSVHTSDPALEAQMRADLAADAERDAPPSPEELRRMIGRIGRKVG